MSQEISMVAPAPCNGKIPVPKKRTAETSECLKYEFTEAEFLDHSRTLARMNQELMRAEERKARVTAELASDLKAKREEVSHQTQLVANGYEYRDIKCEVRFHEPAKGKKTIVRMDTGEVVREAFMSGQELQDAFDFDNPNPAPAQETGLDERMSEQLSTGDVRVKVEGAEHVMRHAIGIFDPPTAADRDPSDDEPF